MLADYNAGVVEGAHEPPTCFSCKYYQNEGYWVEGHFKHRACWAGHHEDVKGHNPPKDWHEFSKALVRRHARSVGTVAV